MTPVYRSNSAEQHAGGVKGAGGAPEPWSGHVWQMALWGYADAILRQRPGFSPAHVCELRGDAYRHLIGAVPWDMPEALDHVTLSGTRPPEWHALWWVGEHIRRGHEPYPGGEAT